jgi:hypothetical protein
MTGDRYFMVVVALLVLGGCGGGSTRMGSKICEADQCITYVTHAPCIGEGCSNIKDLTVLDERLWLLTSGPGTHDGKVMWAPRTGGDPQEIASGLEVPFEMKLTGGYVYWTEPGRVARVPVEGGAVEVLTEASRAYGLAVTAVYVVYADWEEGTIVRLGPMGTRLPLATGMKKPFDVCTDGQDVYYLTAADTIEDRAVWKVPLEGGADPVMLSEPVSAGGGIIEVDYSGVYWSFGSSVYRVDRSGGDLQSVAYGGNIDDFVLDHSGVYWADGDWRFVASVEVPGASPHYYFTSEVFTNVGGMPEVIALGPDAVFWSTGGAVYSADR